MQHVLWSKLGTNVCLLPKRGNCCPSLQDLSAAILPSLVGLSGLQRLHHFSVIVWDGEWPAGDATLLPVPASCAALQSYSAIGAYVYGGLEVSSG